MKKPYTLLNKAEPYLWILPSVILMAIFIIVPIGSVFKMAMSEVSKVGVIDAQQQMLVGADIQTVLDDLQAELVG